MDASQIKPHATAAPQSTLYSRVPLNLGEDEIRLLRLRPGAWGDPVHAEMCTAKLCDGPKYTALSYVWGESAEGYTIWVNGQEFPVTPSLYSALRYLRAHKDTLVTQLWVDAICIDQSSTTEKNHQVALMGDIYSRFQFSDYSHRFQEMLDLLGRIKVCWGHLAMDLQILIDALDTAKCHTEDKCCISAESEHYDIRRSLRGFLQQFSKIARLRQKRGQQRKELLDLCLQFSRREASIEHDRVYALLGLLGSRGRSVIEAPNYGSHFSAVYTQTGLALGPAAP
ncbi:hypothetical protein DL769_001821 [Monosporascus sp. CRB-8-3]|nr:hypothetical protein DL769_001821 [Monosporascus sp. CRB-8-3]